MKEHPDDFNMRIEYVFHAFNQLAEKCEYFQESFCIHPENNIFMVKCAIENCPLLHTEQ